MSLTPPEHPPGVEPTAAQWFATEVHPHDLRLKNYLRGAFPAVRDIDDVVQESYIRVLKARAAQPIRSAKAFLFLVARHVAIDLVRREKISPVNPLVDSAELSVIEERPCASDQLEEQEKIDLLGEALGRLPARCREIMLLHKIKGLSQREIATRLGVANKTVENQIAIGVKRCNTFFRRRKIEHY